MKITKILAISSLSLLVTSCGLLDPVDTPVVKTYKLDSSAALAKLSCTTSKNAPVMQIALFKVDDPFDDRSMYYSDSSYKLTSYSQNEWIARPAKMLTQVTQEKLLASCLYSDVISSEFMTASMYRLAAQVLDFKQVINGDNSTMQLSILVQLVDNKSNGVVKSKVFVEQTSTTADVTGYVNGANTVTGMYLNDLVTWLSSN